MNAFYLKYFYGEKNIKLSSILAINVVNYFSKMRKDDEDTLKLLAERKAIIEQHIKTHSGRIFNTAGDVFLEKNRPGFPNSISLELGKTIAVKYNALLSRSS